MTILFLNSAKSWGGNERWMLQAARKLNEDHTVLLAYRNEVIGDRFSIPKFKFPFVSEADVYTLSLLIKLIHRHHIDVLIPTKRKDYVLAGLAARMTGRVNVLRLGIARKPEPGFFHRFVYSFLADGIIVNANSIRTELIEIPYMNPDQIRVIYNGIFYNEVENLAAQSGPDLPEFSFRVVSVGELSPRKGHDLAIRGFAEFINQHSWPDLKPGLIIIGGGPDEKRLKTLASELGIQNQVVLTGFVKNPYPIVAASDVFLMTSASEGISNALLEAMVLKVPAITTSGAGGAEEFMIQGETGWLIGNDIENDTARFLTEAYLNPELRQRIADRAREDVITRFDSDRMKLEIVEFLKFLISRHK